LASGRGTRDDLLVAQSIARRKLSVIEVVYASLAFRENSMEYGEPPIEIFVLT